MDAPCKSGVALSDSQSRQEGMEGEGETVREEKRDVDTSDPNTNRPLSRRVDELSSDTNVDSASVVESRPSAASLARSA